ncbi:MATE family efflux transporter [Photobacterium aphoticum]|uniref:Multidrug export protein MepA n=1 Tax=Photobacterium aphoticum TaxID=754436 RepID=A0A0J1GJH7_9GAMM|nr:MATE family efflux transporter [Photobacterium aphoticum]KLU99887.1 multidrug transporter [Photobacterium aphoticum]GHA40784.1 MATE family efflux transporter [Photobacterium aphoticum]
MQEITSSSIDPNSTSKTFWRFAIPSIAAMLVNGLYQVIDGMFVGHYIGYEGLAGINLAWPVIGVLAGLGLLVGMGAGSIISIFRGENQQVKAQQTLYTALGLIGIAGLLMMIFLNMLAPTLLIAQGATGNALEMGIAYIEVFSWGAVFTIAAGALPMLIRNDDSPNFSTGLMMAGAIINIVLDYLFIGHFGWALKGAAVATIIAQISITLVAVLYFFSRYSQLRLSVRNACFNVSIALKTVGLGTSSLLMYAYFSFMVALHNKLFMSYGSAVHVGAYAIVGYLVTMYYLLAEGISSGMQPPVSYYYGAKQGEKIRATLVLAAKIVAFTGLIAIAVLNIFPNTLVNLFSQNEPQLAAETINGIRLHLFAMFLDGLFALASVYFMAIDKGGKALAISLGNMLIQLPFLYFMPKLMGVDGIWLAVPLSNIALAFVVIPMVWMDINRRALMKPDHEMALAN